MILLKYKSDHVTPLLKTLQWFLILNKVKSSWWCIGKESSCQCRRCKRCRFNPWVGKIPWRRAWQPTSVFLPTESHRQRSLAGYSPWGHEELDTTEWQHICTKSNVLTVALNACLEMLTWTSPPPSCPSLTLVQLHFSPWNILLLPQDLCTDCLSAWGAFSSSPYMQGSLTLPPFYNLYWNVTFWVKLPWLLFKLQNSLIPSTSYPPYLICFFHNSCYQPLTY